MVENKIINESILQRMRGVPANPATPESDADPRNPTARRSPNMAVPSCSDPNCHDPNCNYDNEPAPEAPGDVAEIVRELRAHAVNRRQIDINAVGENNVAPIDRYFGWSAAEALSSLSAVTAERDHYFKTLHAAADVMERHWKGAGLSNDFEWLSNEIAAYAKDQCTEIESLEARVAELSAEMARAESTIAGLNKKLTEQFELSTKYVGLHQAAEARLAEAVDLLGEARSGYIAGSEYDEAFDERKKSLLSRVG